MRRGRFLYRSSAASSPRAHHPCPFRPCRPGHGKVLATRETLAIMAIRCGPGFAGVAPATGYGESCGLARPRSAFIRPVMCWARRKSAWRAPAARSSFRAIVSARTRPNLRRLRAGRLRCLGYGSDLRPTGFPAFGHARGNRQAVELARAFSRPGASRWRLCFWQGAARHGTSPGGGLRPANLSSGRHREADRVLCERASGPPPAGGGRPAGSRLLRRY